MWLSSSVLDARERPPLRGARVAGDESPRDWAAEGPGWGGGRRQESLAVEGGRDPGAGGDTGSPSNASLRLVTRRGSCRAALRPAALPLMRGSRWTWPRQAWPWDAAAEQELGAEGTGPARRCRLVPCRTRFSERRGPARPLCTHTALSPAPLAPDPPPQTLRLVGGFASGAPHGDATVQTPVRCAWDPAPPAPRPTHSSPRPTRTPPRPHVETRHLAGAPCPEPAARAAGGCRRPE